MSARPIQRIHWGNLSNELMIGSRVTAHALPLERASPRKTWLAAPGDTVVAARPVESDYVNYVCSCLGIAPSQINVVATSPEDWHDTPAFLQGLSKAGKSIVLAPYALERSISKISGETGIPIEGYAAPVDAELVAKVYELNSKPGFRAVAPGLGIPIPDGVSCDSRDDLIDAVRTMLSRHETVMVKLSRSSNGYGSLVLSQAHLEQLPSRLADYCDALQDQPEQYTVEEFLEFQSLPSVEMTVRDDSIQFGYICDQRDGRTGGPSGGMQTPPPGIPLDKQEEMMVIGRQFGAYLQGIGYRGVYDVDGGYTTDGRIIMTEANVRRTAGTHLHEIACRLAGESYLDDRVWVSGSLPMWNEHSFRDGVELLAMDGLRYDRDQRTGAIFTVDDPEGRKWHYQIIAPTTAEAEVLEQRLIKSLT